MFNGQHTIEIVAAKSGSRDTPVWCMIYDDLNYEQEADIFANQMKFVKPLLPYEVFNANLEAGNPDQQMIKQIVESYGMELGKTKSANTITAISTIEAIYKKHGYHMLDQVMRMCIGTWEGESMSFSSNMLNAICLLIVAYGEGRAGVCKDSPSDPARNAYFRPAKAAPARSPSVPLKYRSSFSKADSGMLHISGQYASPFAIVLPPFSDAERKAGVLCCIPEKKKVPEKGLFNVDGFFSSRGNTGPLIQTGGCRNCRGRFCRDPIRCVRSVPSCRGLCRPAR